MLAEDTTKMAPAMNLPKEGNIVLSTRRLHKAYGGQVVLDDVSLDLKQGEVVLLRGENGSGKTTLLNILTGNLEPDKGELHVSINGDKEEFSWPRSWWKELNPFDHFTPERLAWEGIGRVWQDIRLFPTMTTLDNVAVAAQGKKGENPALALHRSSNGEAENIEISSRWLKRLGLGERLDSSCDKISLGQMKRVAIARAIHAGAKVLFLDEPLSGLDKNGVQEVMGYLGTLVKDHSITLVIVEHVFNIPIILGLADTVWTLLDGKIAVANKNEIKKEAGSGSHSIHALLRSIAGENGKIDTMELPGGARLTTASPFGTDDSEVVLEVKDLVVKRGMRTVINGLSFNLRKGQLSILEAPNGWGKSSLLDAIAGIHPMESGKITLNGEDINSLPTYKRIELGMAYLRSNQQVFPSLAVKDHHRLAKIQSASFGNSLNDMSKGNFLSGGEKQKLLIDMLPDAEVYLLDEPMMGLDNKAIDTVAEYVFQSIKRGQKSIFITLPSCTRHNNNHQLHNFADLPLKIFNSNDTENKGVLQ